MKNGLAFHDFLQRAVAHAQTRLVRSSFHSFGSRSVIFGPVRLAGAEGISVGDRVYVGSGCWLQGAVEGVSPPDDGSARLRIGNGVSLSGFSTLSAARSVVIEDKVLIARNVFICDHTHAIDRPVPICDQGITGIAPVRIGRGAWIGQNSVILPGVTVGEGAVVAANSVVKMDVAGRTVVGGTPARLLRSLDAAATEHETEEHADESVAGWRASL